MGPYGLISKQLKGTRYANAREIQSAIKDKNKLGTMGSSENAPSSFASKFKIWGKWIAIVGTIVSIVSASIILYKYYQSDLRRPSIEAEGKKKIRILYKNKLIVWRSISINNLGRPTSLKSLRLLIIDNKGL